MKNSMLAGKRKEEEVVNAKSEIRGMFNFQGFFFFIPGLSHKQASSKNAHKRFFPYLVMFLLVGLSLFLIGNLVMLLQ